MFLGNVKKRFSKKNYFLSNLVGEGHINNSHDLPLTVHCKMGSVFCVTQPLVIIPHGGYAIRWLQDVNFLQIGSMRRVLLEAIVVGS